MESWLGLAVISAAALLSDPGLPLPPQRAAIAQSVAARGLPQCWRYYPDGREGPCLPEFAARSGRQVNAWSARGHIVFSQGAVERLDADEFALLAGHEMAHLMLGSSLKGRAAELAADRLGAELACSAGFDLARAAGLFDHLASDADHPSARERRAAVLSAICPAASEV